MIELYLNRGNSREGVYLRLPATPCEVGEAFGMLEKLGEGKVAIFNVKSPVRNLKRYIMNTDVSNQDNLAKLQTIAETIDSMNSTQQHIFSGALDAESINGLDDVIRLSQSLDQYIILPNVCSDVALGRYLVENECHYKDFPEQVRPYLDYRAIGAEYYAENGGAYGPGGYVRRKTERTQHQEQRDAVITLHLETERDNFRLCLPLTDTELESVKNRLGINHFAEAKIAIVECKIPYVGEMICDLGCPSVKFYNFLSDELECLLEKGGAILTYAAVLEVEQPETVENAWNLAWNLDDYERITEDASEYGKSVLERIGADEEIINTIDGYMDFEKFGEDAMVEDGVRQTEFGLLRRRSSPFPEIVQEQQMF